MIAREIGAACEPTSAEFAARLADWQAAHSLVGTGEMDATTIAAMANVWLMRRPFVAASKIECPDAPNAETLMRTDPAEAFGGKTISARIDALAAYRRMAAAMRGEPGAEAAALKIASAYRDPIEEAARCADGGCGTPAKARCSAHRTGLAFDFYLGAAPGLDPFSTDPANRLFISRTPTYRWLVKNADRFGFVNYPYEPWHWEWTGEPKQDRTR
jgi:D-alanyl-D-alanine carboxypeptidase